MEKKRCWRITRANFSSSDLEIINSRIILFKDIQWSLEKDVLDNFAKIIDLSGAKNSTAISPAAFKKYRQINLLLNSLNRLEVRGRDSAGLQITFTLKKRSRHGKYPVWLTGERIIRGLFKAVAER